MQKLFIGLVFCCIPFISQSCEMCSCGSGGNQIGLLPHLQRSFIGIRYQFQSTYTEAHHSNETGVQSQEQFHTAELWGRVKLFKRLQLYAAIPYRINEQREPNVITKVTGIGDALLQFNTDIVNTFRSENSWKFMIQGGIGVKLPSGKYNLVRQGLMVHQNLQSGTGSFDFPFQLNVLVRKNNVGLLSETLFRRNGTNKMNYALGNLWQETLKMLYWYERKNFTIIPNIAMAGEQRIKDLQNKQRIDYTGGQVTSAIVGCDFTSQRHGGGIQAGIPIWQHLGDGYVHLQSKLSFYYIYLLKHNN